MGRAILSVVVGLVCMQVAMSVVFITGFLVMGADRVYREGVFDVSPTWIAFSAVMIFLCALIGGILCAAIAGRPGPVRALAVLAALTFLFELYQMATKEDQGPRTGEVSVLEAPVKSVLPLWAPLLNLGAGVTGVLAGGRGATKKRA